MTNTEAAASLVALYAEYVQSKYANTAYEEAVAMACGTLMRNAGYDSLFDKYRMEVNCNDRSKT